jgi:hypothetical protein
VTDDLAREAVGAKTITAYRADLSHFSRWFAGSTSATFRAAAVTLVEREEVRD